MGGCLGSRTRNKEEKKRISTKFTKDLLENSDEEIFIKSHGVGKWRVPRELFVKGTKISKWITERKRTRLRIYGGKKKSIRRINENRFYL